MLGRDGVLHAVSTATGSVQLLLSDQVLTKSDDKIACMVSELFRPAVALPVSFLALPALQGRVGRPRCAAYNPASGRLCIAGEGAKKAPCVSLWQLGASDGAMPALLACTGSPARAPMFGLRTDKRQDRGWAACICSSGRRGTLLFADPGMPLHAYTWEVLSLLAACVRACVLLAMPDMWNRQRCAYASF